jgi:UrcA family protein
MKLHMKPHSTLGLLLASSLAAGVATAGAPGSAEALTAKEVTSSEIVRYQASEVQDQRAARELYQRIRGAAAEVCRISGFPRGYEIWFEHDCEAQAAAEAVRSADSPALDEYVEKLRR